MLMGENMGRAKTEQIEAEERGWSSPDTFICSSCVEDEYLQSLIYQNLEASFCSYCECRSTAPISANADIVLEAIYRAIGYYYADPTQVGVPYDKGFILETLDLHTVLENLGLDVCSRFLNDVIDVDTYGGDYVEVANGDWRDMHQHDIMRFGWESFSTIVKHKTRFFFTQSSGVPEACSCEIDVPSMLPMIADKLRPLICTLPKESIVYRARVRKKGDTWEPTANELGAPPRERATAGRMNPSGISYFYSSFDRETAYREVGSDCENEAVYIASLRLTSDIQIIDLSQPLSLPSIYDVDRYHLRESFLFVNDFRKAISAPVAKDGREHIAYVPSQILCEYLAQVFRTESGKNIDGLIFPSSLQSGGKNLVLFPKYSDGTPFCCASFVDVSCTENLALNNINT